MPNGYIKSKNGTPIELVDASARQRITALENSGGSSSYKVYQCTVTYDSSADDYTVTTEATLSEILSLINAGTSVAMELVVIGINENKTTLPLAWHNGKSTAVFKSVSIDNEGSVTTHTIKFNNSNIYYWINKDEYGTVKYPENYNTKQMVVFDPDMYEFSCEAMPTSFSGSYNDLTDKPTIPDTSNLLSSAYFLCKISFNWGDEVTDISCDKTFDEMLEAYRNGKIVCLYRDYYNTGNKNMIMPVETVVDTESYKQMIFDYWIIDDENHQLTSRLRFYCDNGVWTGDYFTPNVYEPKTLYPDSIGEWEDYNVDDFNNLHIGGATCLKVNYDDAHNCQANLLYAGYKKDGDNYIDLFSGYSHGGDKIAKVEFKTDEYVTFVKYRYTEEDIPTQFSGSYNDLADKPTIPTKTSDITNDKNFIGVTQIPEETTITFEYLWNLADGWYQYDGYIDDGLKSVWDENIGVYQLGLFKIAHFESEEVYVLCNIGSTWQTYFTIRNNVSESTTGYSIELFEEVVKMSDIPDDYIPYPRDEDWNIIDEGIDGKVLSVKTVTSGSNSWNETCWVDLPTVTNDFTDTYKNRIDTLTDDYIKGLFTDANEVSY